MKKCYIHIGNFKTGSTSIQSFLFLNKKLFEEKNFKLIYEKNFFKNTIPNQILFKYFDKKSFKKIKFWNLKRVFYLLYLNHFQKKIFSQSQLDLND